jgi:transcription elongation factor SPT5
VIQRGQEAQVVFKLLQRDIALDCTTKVLSALFRPLLPGSIYIEAPSRLDVHLACAQLQGVIPSHPIELVPIEDAVDIVTCGSAGLAPEANSWVRVRRGVYKGDLAFVRQITEPSLNDDDVFPSSIVTINIIPRISDGETHKRKRVEPHVPEAAFIDSRRYGTECKQVEGKEDTWTFRGQTFYKDLLVCEVAMTGLNFKKVTPTREELIKWLESRDDVVSLAAKVALAKLTSVERTSALQPDDRVEVKAGWAQGKKGRVQSIRGDEVSLFMGDQPSGLVTILAKDLQKYFNIGELVTVISGPEAGLNGWCIGMEDSIVLVSEHGTHREVRTHI